MDSIQGGMVSAPPVFLTQDPETSFVVDNRPECIGVETILEEDEGQESDHEEKGEVAKQEVTEAWGSSNDGEYETDLEIDEDELLNPDKEEFDNSGKSKYMKLCDESGVTPVSYYARHLRDRELQMKFHGLSAEEMRTLSAPLEINTYIEKLDLQGNGIDGDGVETLCSGIKESVYISDIILSDNKIGNNGTMAICKLLEVNRNIKKLDLSGNDIDDYAAEYLFDAMTVNRGLLKLSLGHNSFEDKSAVWLKGILSDNETLEELGLQWNKFSTRACVTIIEGLQENVGMKTFIMTGAGLGPPGAKAVGKALEENRSLQHLDISFTRIPLSAINHVASGLKQNETLKELMIGSNPFGADGAAQLIQSQIENDTSALRFLDMNNIMITHDCETQIAQLFEKTGLRVVYEDVIPSVSIFNNKRFPTEEELKDPVFKLNFLFYNMGLKIEDFAKGSGFSLPVSNVLSTLKKKVPDMPLDNVETLLQYIKEDDVVDCRKLFSEPKSRLREIRPETR